MQQYPEVVLPSSGIPNAFYAVGLKGPAPLPLSIIAGAVQFIVPFVGYRFGKDASLAGMAGSLPGPVFEELKDSGAILQNQLGAFQELVCLPESFPVIDEYNQGRWAIFPLEF